MGCRHEWSIEITSLGSPVREVQCAKCGESKSDPLPSSAARFFLVPSGVSVSAATNAVLAATGWPGGDAPPKEMELTFATEPIVGWRMWRVVDFARHGGIVEPRLAPFAASALWEPRVRFEARCEPIRGGFFLDAIARHESPWPSCDCGVWAVRDRQTAEEKAFAANAQVVVFGEVYLWGRVLEFDRGYRARYAYPKRLIMHQSGRGYSENRLVHETASELERLYGVPVHVIRNPRLAAVDEAREIAFGRAASAAANAGQSVAVAFGNVGFSAAQAAKAMKQLGAMLHEDARQMTLPKPRTDPPPRSKPTGRDAFKKRR